LTCAAIGAYRHPVFGSCEGGAFVVFTNVLDSHFSRVPAVTPPPAVAARLDSVPMPAPEKKQEARRAPARVDHPFKGIALVLLSTVFLGCSDVTA
jgi:hypothetical protein